VALNELKIYCFTSFYVQIQKLALGFLYYQKLLRITLMSHLINLTPPSEHSAEPLLFASKTEQDHAAATIDEGMNTTSIFRHLYTPRVACGQDFTLRQVLFGLFLVFCLTPWASPPIALALGLVLAQTVGNPFTAHTKAFTNKLLQFSVIGLGFGMNAHAAVQAGKEGF
jgi:hypothetical protein